MKFLWSDPGAAPPWTLSGGASDLKFPQDTGGVGLTSEPMFCWEATSNLITGQKSFLSGIICGIKKIPYSNHIIPYMCNLVPNHWSIKKTFSFTTVSCSQKSARFSIWTLQNLWKEISILPCDGLATSPNDSWVRLQLTPVALIVSFSRRSSFFSAEWKEVQSGNVTHTCTKR